MPEMDWRTINVDSAVALAASSLIEDTPSSDIILPRLHIMSLGGIPEPPTHGSWFQCRCYYAMRHKFFRKLRRNLQQAVGRYLENLNKKGGFRLASPERGIIIASQRLINGVASACNQAEFILNTTQDEELSPDFLNLKEAIYMVLHIFREELQMAAESLDMGIES